MESPERPATVGAVAATPVRMLGQSTSGHFAVLMGLTSTGWIAFQKQNNFVVHFLRRNPGMSICRRRVPYQHRFIQLPSNAIFCHECLHSGSLNAPPYARRKEETTDECQGSVSPSNVRNINSSIRGDA